MIWITEFIKDKNYMRAVLGGKFDVDDHLAMIKSIVSLAAWKPGMNILLDSRRVDYTHSSLDVMRQAGGNMAKFDKEIGNGKAAILMASLISFGKGRQFEMVTEENVSAHIGVFSEEKRAIDWLAAF